ncbi:MAG: methyltransferase domain-containing protein [Nanoarchaeota archaeon]|nr:methyltransferase domain-containing protein [Nanoarchaeota archaeon]
MIENIVQDLVGKKELRDIDRNFVRKIVEKEFGEFLGCGSVDYGRLKRNREFRKKFKEVREVLRKVYGMFRQVREKRVVGVYDEIFKRIGRVKSILDVGCGLGPLDFPFDKYGVKYYACDISKGDVEAIKDIVEKNGGKGGSRAFVFDLVFGDYSKLPEADVCFCLKVLESLEEVEKGISEKLLKGLRCKWVVVSFAKRSLGGRKVIKKQGRVWLMRSLNKLGWKWEVFNSGDEIFFVIRKK